MEFKKTPRQHTGRPPVTVPQRPAVVLPSQTPVERIPQRRSRFHMSKRALVISVASMLIVLAGIYLLMTTLAKNGPHNTDTPDYATVLPAGTSITQLGGWKRVSPPKSEPVFAFVDTIDGTPVSVSQQPLPSSLKGGSDQIADLAKKFNATTPLEAGDTKAYLGSSVKGPQSVILTKKNLLILIKSQQEIPVASWVRYIEALK